MDFYHFKNSIELVLEESSFFYSGDVISSEEIFFDRESKSKIFLPELVIHALTEVYNISFEKMKSRSKEVILKKEDFSPSDFDKIISDKIRQIDAKMFFHSKNFDESNYRKIGLGILLQNKMQRPDVKLKHHLPDWFLKKNNFYLDQKTITGYFSPLILDCNDDLCLYFIDKPIQSAVWIIQNMDYFISENKHTIKIPLYDCQYQSLKIRLVNTEKIRQEKINQILK